MATSNGVGPEIAGAIARFWTSGAGPSHSSISTALALAGVEGAESVGTKQDRVLLAIRNAPEDVGRRVVEEFLSLLRTAGQFDSDLEDERVLGAQRAFSRRGYSLDADGYVDWTTAPEPSSTPSMIPAGATPLPREPRVVAAPAEPDGTNMTVTEVTVPGLSLLTDCLRRLPSALRPLQERRRSRPGIGVADEYDLQDFVESLLRTLYHDVRPEERTPSYAGSSSVMDFLLKDDAVAIEVKVTGPRRTERDIKPELLVDIHDYKQHPHVRTLVVVVYDLASTIRNPVGFENDLTGSHNGLDVRVIVVGWPLPKSLGSGGAPGPG